MQNKDTNSNLGHTQNFLHPNDILGLRGVTDVTIEEAEGLRSGVELVRSGSDKHFDLLRPSARNYSLFKGSFSSWELGSKNT